MRENPNVICNECGFCKQNKILKQQLEIAVEALKVYEKSFIGNGKNSVILENGIILEYNPKIAEKALNDIKELET